LAGTTGFYVRCTRHAIIVLLWHCIASILVGPALLPALSSPPNNALNPTPHSIPSFFFVLASPAASALCLCSAATGASAWADRIPRGGGRGPARVPCRRWRRWTSPPSGTSRRRCRRRTSPGSHSGLSSGSWSRPCSDHSSPPSSSRRTTCRRCCSRR